MALLVHATPYLLESNHGPNLGVQYNLIITSIEQVGTYYLPDMYLCIMGPEGEGHFTFFFIKITIHVSSVQNQSI
jgi:hypothetical protein